MSERTEVIQGDQYPFPRLYWEEGKARERLEKLVAAGCERVVVTSFLIALKASTVMPKLNPQTLPRGMTQRILDNLPSRIEMMAGEIERVNEHAFFNPVWISSSLIKPAHPLLERDLTVLPQIMRQYAAYLSARGKSFGKFRQGYGRRGVEERQLIRHLMTYVQQKTGGKPYYEAIADLLSAALTTDPSYTPDALRRLAARRGSPLRNTAGLNAKR